MKKTYAFFAGALILALAARWAGAESYEEWLKREREEQKEFQQKGRVSPRTPAAPAKSAPAPASRTQSPAQVAVPPAAEPPASPEAPASAPEILLRQEGPAAPAASAPAAVKSAVPAKAAAPGGKTVILPIPYTSQSYGACWTAGAIMMMRAYNSSMRLETLLHRLKEHVDYLNAGDGFYGLSHVDERWKALAREMSQAAGNGFVHEFYMGHSGSFLAKLTGLLDQGKPVMVAMAKHMILVVGYRMEKAADGTDKYWLYLHDSRATCPDSAGEGNLYWEVTWEWFRDRKDPNYSTVGGHRGQLVYPTNGIPRTAPLVMMDTPSALDLHGNDDVGFRVYPMAYRYSVMVLPKNTGGLGWEAPRQKLPQDPSGQRPPIAIPAEADELAVKLGLWNADLDNPSPEMRMEIVVVDAKSQDRITNLTESVQLPPGRGMKSAGPQYFEAAFPVSSWRREGASRPGTFQASLLDSANACIDSFYCDFELAPLPKVSGFDPEHAAPGTGLTILGEDFGTNGFRVGSVRIGVTPMEIVSWTDKEIKVVLPPVTTPGDVVVACGRCEAKPVRYSPGPAAQKVLVGDVAEVSIQPPDDPSGRARWVVVGDQREVDFKDIPELRDTPYDRYSPVVGYYGKYRCDIATVEETQVGSMIQARIQFTDLNMTNMTGTHRLMRICLPDEPNNFEAAQKVEGDVMERITGAWTPQDASNWLEEQEQYRARVRAMNLPDWLTVELEWKHGFVLYKDTGLGIDPADIDTRYRMVVVDIVPCKLAMAPGPGWKVTGTNSAYDRTMARSLGRDWEGEKIDQTQILSSSAGLSFQITAETNLPAQFRKGHEAAGWSAAPARWSEYEGTAYTWQTNSTEHRKDLNERDTAQQTEDRVMKETRVDFLLQKGKLFLTGSFRYRADALHAVKFVNQRYGENGEFLGADKEVVGDGRPRLDGLLEKIRGEIDAMLNSIRLVPRDTPAKQAGLLKRIFGRSGQ